MPSRPETNTTRPPLTEQLANWPKKGFPIICSQLQDAILVLFEQPPLDLCLLHPARWCTTNLAPNSLRPCVLYHSHYPILAFHPAEGHMYGNMGCKFEYPHTGKEVYRTFGDCRDWLLCQISCSHLSSKCHWNLSANESLKILALDIVRLLTKIITRNQIIIVITDCYTSYPGLSCDLKPLLSLFCLFHSVIRSLQTGFLLFFSCQSSAFRKWIPPDVLYVPRGKTAYDYCISYPNEWSSGRPQENCHQVLPSLRVQQERHWDLFVRSLTYAYNLEVHCTIRKTAFSFVVPLHPRIPHWSNTRPCRLNLRRKRVQEGSAPAFHPVYSKYITTPRPK